MPMRLDRSLRRLVLLAALAVAGTAAAQAPGAAVDLVLRGVAADDALAAVASEAQVDIVYSTALVGTRPVWCGGAGWDADDLLRCITDAVGLDFVRRSSGTYVITERVVEPVEPGAVAGLVVDAASGEPLPLAHVRLAGATAVTDIDGRFAIPGLTPGPHTLLVSYVGYRSRAATVVVGSGDVARETVGLRPAVASVGTVVVDGLESRYASDALGADAGFERLGERPGDGRDDRPLAGGAPAPTSSVDGVVLRPLLGIAERSYRDGLSLQGGEPGEHVLQLDGATIYEPLAIGPTLGAMSPLAVGRVTVRKAGFGARTGSYLAGVLQAQHALARPAGGAPAGVAVEADAYAASARLQHQARLGRWAGEPVEATSLVAVRRSLWDLRPPRALDRTLREWNAVDPVLAAALDGTEPRSGFDAHRHGSDVSFSDVHAATRLRLGALRSVQASLYRGTSGVGTELFAVGASDAGDSASALEPGAMLLARDGTHWTNLAATVRADALVSARWRVGAGARLSRHSLRQRYDAVTGLQAGLTGSEPTEVAEARLGAVLDSLHAAGNGNRLTDLTLSADAALALATGHEVGLGVEASWVASRFHLLSSGFGAAAFRDLDASHRQLRVATVADGHHRLGGRWTLEPGLRMTALTASGDVIAEPRLALRFDAMETDRLAGVPLAGLAARLAAGVYRQFVSRVELDTYGPSALVPSVAVWLPTDATVAAPSALHLAGEILWQPSAAWSARVEGYAKALPRVYALDYAALLGADAGAVALAGQADFLLAQRGRARGVGVRVERHTTRWAATAGLAVARTERQSEARYGGRWVAAPWAEPVRATLGVDVLALGSRTGGRLRLRARGLGVWGRAWAYRRAYYDILTVHSGSPSLGGVALDRPEDDRLSPLVVVDLGVAYEQALGGSRRVEVAADVANVLGRRNVLDWSLRPDGAGGLAPLTRTLPGVQPSLRVRVAL